MATVEGYDPAELDQQASLLEEAIAAALLAAAVQATADVLTPDLPAPPDIDALSIITTLWTIRLDRDLIPVVRTIIDTSAARIADGIRQAVPTIPVPPLSDVTATDLLAHARNRLVGIGDDLWTDIRAGLVEGITAGDSIPQLAARIRQVVPVTERRARTIARTEVVGVSNAASIAQARSAGVEMTKIWNSTEDIRTRLFHVDADNQQVPLNDSFEVGEEELDYPGDPRGRPDNIINCRCAIRFGIDGAAPVTAAARAYVRDGEGQFAEVPGSAVPSDKMNLGDAFGAGLTTAATAVDSFPDVWVHLPDRHDQSSRSATKDEVRVPTTAATVLDNEEEQIMPWHLVQDSAACDGGWAVVKDDDGSTVGCHDSRESAVAQLRALYAAAPAAAREQGCVPGQHRMPDGECMPDEQMAVRPMWHAVAHIEGVTTGRRVWLPGSLTWRAPPFALHWEYASAAHGGQPMTVHVGNVTDVQRDGNTIHAWGSIDLNAAEGKEFARKLVEGYARGISIGPGDENIIYDAIWSADDPDGFGEPEQIIFRDYRIGELTAVSVPGQEGPYIEPTPELVDLLSDVQVVTAAAVGSHDTPTSDVDWDKGVNVGRLPSPVSVDTARRVFAWIDETRSEDGEIPKDAGKFPHHLVSSDGRPGDAVEAACSNGLARLGGSDIPAADKRGVYSHLRGHLIDAGRDPDSIAPFNAVITTAAGSWTITIPDLPPADWFDWPADLPPRAAVTVTDEGRIFGYLAPAHANHRVYARNGQRKTIADLARTDYSRWLRETHVAGGGRVLAGPVTMECMHAPKQDFGTLERRHQYYEDSCAIVARVAIGDDEQGRWIAGALMPGLTPEQITKLMMCDVSLDSQPHPDKPGWEDFVAVLAVPYGGWPKERHSPSVSTTRIVESVDAVIVTAATVPLLFATATPTVDPQVIYLLADRVTRPEQEKLP